MPLLNPNEQVTAQPDSVFFTISPRKLTSLVLVALPLLFFYPALLGQVVLMPGDGWVQNFGVRYLAGQILAHGQLPLWNPYIFAGTPLLASVYPGVLYPPNWLFAILPPVAAMNTVVLISFELALIGSYLYAHKIGINRASAILAGSLFTFGGFMIAHLGHTSRIAAAAWLPWVLLALEQLFQTGKWRWVALGALFLALQFVAGEPQMTFNTALVAAIYAAFSLLFRTSQAAKIRFMIFGFCMALCGGLFSLLQYFPARELQTQGTRAQLDYEYFAAFSLHPQQLLTLIFPYFFGGGAIRPYIQATFGNSFWGIGVPAGYIGLLGLMLALIAIFRGRKNSLIVLWAIIAGAALILALGDYLPFGLNHFLYRIPFYNLFRGSYRHLLEYTFAAALLAGFGANELEKLARTARLRLASISAAILAVAVIATAILYRFFAHRFASSQPRLPEFGFFMNPEAWIPMLTFLLSGIALFCFVWRLSFATKALLLLVAIVDVGTFGWFFEWHNARKELVARIPNSSSVKYIKSRETDFSSFRILSYGLQPFSENYEELNFPNNSILRGLQSVNGYDVLELGRFRDIAGEMTTEGKVQDRNAFGAAHTGFDLLNVKYFLRERRSTIESGRGVIYEGIRFAETPTDIRLSSGSHFVTELEPVRASEIAFVSALANSADLADNTPILKIKLHTTDNKIIERDFVAGRDSAEWAYDRSDVRAAAKHQRAKVIEDYAAEGFTAHRYLARLKFEAAEIKRVEIDYAAPSAELLIARASLFDAASGTATTINEESLSAARWQKLGSFGNVELYENLNFLPRAWAVKSIAVQPSAEVIRIVKEGKFSDGSKFDPRETALLELEDFGGKQFSLPPIDQNKSAQIKVINYQPQSITLESEHNESSFLVLSEIYYRGWEAKIDGVRVPVYRVNHTLRGLNLPAGKHRIEFFYRAPSLKTGAWYALLSCLILSIGAVVSLARQPNKTSAQNWIAALRQNFQHEIISLRNAMNANKDEAFVISTENLSRAIVPVILGLGLFALLHVYVNNGFVFQPIRSDGVGYYLYLPAVFLAHDISLEKTIAQQFAGKTEEWMGVARYPATGKLLNRYPLGEAVLLAPFFFAGHLLAKISGATTDGFSAPYQFMTTLAGLFYLAAGLFLLRRILLQHFSSLTTVVTLIAITFATNLFHYGTSDNIFSHVYSFFLFSALIYLAEKWYEQTQTANTILLAVVAGLIVIVRPTNAIFLLFVPLLGIVDRSSLQARIAFLRSQISAVLIGLTIFFLTILPLLLYWKFCTGHWLVNSYQGLHFNWTRPEIMKVLFSVRKGLFFWSPILLLALAGFAFIKRYWQGFLFPALLILLLHTYVIASWPAWWYGGSFGHRAFAETLPLFAILFAALLERLREKPLVYRATLAVSGFLLVLSLKFMIQYWNAVIPYDESTIAILANTFFQMSK